MLTPFQAALQAYGEALVAYYADPSDLAYAQLTRAQNHLAVMAQEEAAIRDEG